MASLPEDPEDRTDEQREATEGAAAEDTGEGTEPGRPGVPSWRKAGFGTQMVAASMVGLAEALYGPREQPAIILEASGGPPGDRGLDVHLDPDHPDQSVVVVRPWLLGRREGDEPDGSAPAGRP